MIRLLKSDRKGNIWIVYAHFPKDRFAYYDGNNWIEIITNLNEIVVHDIEVYGDQIIIGTSNGIYKTLMQ